MRWLLIALLSVAAVAKPMPYREAGLTPRQAAAHLVSRFTFGARPDEVDRVVEIGLEEWFSRQLSATPEGAAPDGSLREQKLWRALRTESQVAEVMTDFWFNHFNVSTTTDASQYVRAYENDAIRPFALTSFRQLLGATAKHPAMLQYLDNANSTAGEAEPVGMAGGGPMKGQPRDPLGYGPARKGYTPPPRVRNRGINENYARELMELHTLGVDGGYSQKDVVEVARALTGWSFEGPGTFKFKGENHDFGPKTILRKRFAPGKGIEEGEQILDMLTGHPSTARHLATKLARRFVSDDPPPELVKRLTMRFAATRGDMKAVLWEIVGSPEFWDREKSLRAKIKSPFELVVSALRALGATPVNAGALVGWVETMGQPLYAYAAPTGFPDRAQHWINPGLLLHRMNFMARLPREVKVDLSGLVTPPPATTQEAIVAYTRVLMPERSLGSLEKDLTASARDPGYSARVAQSAKAGKVVKGKPSTPLETVDVVNVVGVLLGSPEFQRR